MAIALRDVISAPAMTTFLFHRALIHGRVYHSKCYGRVHQRNSYTVTFQEGSLSYGQIECFVKVRQNCCRCPVPAICTCTEWIYLAVVNRLNVTNDPVRSPSLRACNSHNKPMQRHFYRTVYLRHFSREIGQFQFI